MFAFIAYAALVWFAAVRWRRTWLGWSAVAAGILGIVLVGYLHWQINEWTQGRIFLRVLQVLLYPYGLLVASVGFFICALPVRYAGASCRSCGYDLRGLETDERTCPECGVGHMLSHERGDSCRRCDAPLKETREESVACHRCAAVHVFRGAGHRAFDQESADDSGPRLAGIEATPERAGKAGRSAPEFSRTLRSIAEAQAETGRAG